MCGPDPIKDGPHIFFDQSGVEEAPDIRCGIGCAVTLAFEWDFTDFRRESHFFEVLVNFF